MSPSVFSYVSAFERNCPHVRLTEDEREELTRLILIYGEEKAQRALATHAEASKQEVKSNEQVSP